MSNSVTAMFSEPEEFEAALWVEGLAGLVITGRGQFRARLTQIALNRMRLSAAEEKLSRIAFVVVPADMVLVWFPIDNAEVPICGGIGVHANELLTVCSGQQFHSVSNGATHWGAIQLRRNVLTKYRVRLSGTAFSILPGVQRWRPPPAANRQLRSLHAAAIRSAARCPQALADTEAAHGLEQQLLHAVLDCLSNSSTDETSRAVRRGQDVMIRFEELLRNQQSSMLSLSKICALLQVSERRLRQLCAQHLGMSPTSYDRLRRMSLVRRALRRADPGSDSVSAVARHNGFRDLGRFAVNYRAVFGETPSTTLRHGI